MNAHKVNKVLVVVVQFVRAAIAIGIALATTNVTNGQPLDANTESTTSWQFFAEVKLAHSKDAKLFTRIRSKDAKLFDIILPPSVFAKARHDLADLRLYDASGGEVPYALRVRRAEARIEPFAAERFNESLDASGARQVSLDLGKENLRHNNLLLSLHGDYFRREVVLEGSDDGSQWKKITTKFVVKVQSGGQRIDDQSLTYPPSRFRYLRLHVSKDQLQGNSATIRSVTVNHRVDIPGEMHTREGQLGHRRAGRYFGNEGSAWFIDLGGDDVPCEKISVVVNDDDFVRNYRIEAGGPSGSNEPFRVITSGTWRRRAGQKREPLIAEFDEVRASRLQLVVTDDRNPALNIESVKFSAPARQVVFAKPVDGDQILRLYFGNPRASQPNYDFDRNLPDTLDPAPARCPLGQPQVNPQYIPEALPFTERWPWVIYLVLASVSGVLGYIIVNISRTAIALHDGEHSSDQSERDSETTP